MPYQSLEQAIQSVGDPVTLLRNSQIGPYEFPVVKSEFTNWRDEQQAWWDTCALFDQSHHMTDLYIEGPDALEALSVLGVNSFATFTVNQAKQFVACNSAGYVIGDAILFYLDHLSFNLVGRPPAANWVQYNLENGKHKVKLTRDDRSAVRGGNRRSFRFQIQGPTAGEVMEAAIGSAMPDIRFFNMAEVTIAGHPVRALRHGMVGQPGWELFGAWDHVEEVRQAILEAGASYGIRQVGARTYPTTCLESGWIPSPLPAVYEGDDMKSYREWLGGQSYEASASLGGSFISSDITDYYLTPYDLGYGAFVKFDHDFVGREALELMATQPARQKVTLVWNDADVTDAIGSVFTKDGDPAKYIDLPLANYATLPYDIVKSGDRAVGISTYTGYVPSQRGIVSLAMVDDNAKEFGTEVTVVWGEEGGRSVKPTVEPHRQVEIRATVAPAPISDVARTAYRPRASTLETTAA